MTASIGDLALMGGVSTPTMREYVTKGQFEAVAPGRYPLVACMQVYTKSLRTQASGRPPDAARTELAKAQAAIACQIASKCDPLSRPITTPRVTRSLAVTDSRFIRMRMRRHCRAGGRV